MDHEEIGLKGVGCIQLVQEREQWRALVIAVMNRWVP
jgi:hypothetical protein